MATLGNRVPESVLHELVNYSGILVTFDSHYFGLQLSAIFDNTYLTIVRPHRMHRVQRCGLLSYR